MVGSSTTPGAVVQAPPNFRRQPGSVERRGAGECGEVHEQAGDEPGAGSLMLILSRRKQAHAGPGAAGSGELQIVLRYQASPVGGQGGWTEQPAGGIVVRLFKMSEQPVAKHPVSSTTTDEEVRALLVRYRCLVPFHVVRTRFLGNIASPGMGVSPIKMVERLWGGEFPEFETIGAANELIGALVMGLWNRLSRHQDRNSPSALPGSRPRRREKGLLPWRCCDGGNSMVSSKGCLAWRKR